MKRWNIRRDCHSRAHSQSWARFGNPAGNIYRAISRRNQGKKLLAQVCTDLRIGGIPDISAGKYVSSQAPSAGASEEGTL